MRVPLAKGLSSLLLLAACATPEPPTPHEVAGASLTARKGQVHHLRCEPSTERLYILLRGGRDGTEETRAVAYNDDNFELLQRICGFLQATGRDVVLFGEPTTGHQEILLGIDLEIQAIEYYDPGLERVMLVDTRYGDRLADTADTRSILKWVLVKMRDTAEGAIKP